MRSAFFITGTDTDVGKTYITSALIRHFSLQRLSVIGMKPVAAGCEFADGAWLSQDVAQLITASNVQAHIHDINPYAFTPPIAPHIAASQAGVAIELDVIIAAFARLSKLAEIVIVEGAGGFLVPLNNQQTMADLALKLNIPIILVVGMKLGCINHALLTVEAIKSRGLILAGWVANQVDTQMAEYAANVHTLQQAILEPCLAEVGWGEVPVFDLVG